LAYYSDERWLDWVDALSENDFVIIDDFLPIDLYQKLKAFFVEKLGEDEFHRAGLGSSKHLLDTSIRGDFTYWIDVMRDSELSEIFQLIEETISIFNKYCYLSLSGYEFHLAHYPAGTFYKKHLDQFKDRNNRMISMIIYLNENWKKGDGGELKIFRHDKEILVDPISRRCAIFKSADVPHEVMATNVGRFSLTGWLLYQPSGIGYLGQ